MGEAMRKEVVMIRVCTKSIQDDDIVMCECTSEEDIEY